MEAALTRAEALTIDNRPEEALEVFAAVHAEVGVTGAPELEVRALVGRARALVRLGEARRALDLLASARALVESPEFSDLDRADVLLRMGICRYTLASIATSVALLNEALALAERSGELPCDGLKAEILHWRAYCRRRQRDFEAAREDIEAAIELAEAAADTRMLANSYFQASIVAERTGHLILSRRYAVQARELYQELEDVRNVGQMTLNLGGLQLLLGHEDEAVEHLTAAFGLAVEAGMPPDAARALGGLATVHLQQGNYPAAVDHARRSLSFSRDGRTSSTRSVGLSSRWAGRSWSRDCGMKRNKASGPRTRRTSSTRLLRIGRGLGWRWVTSQVVGGTTARRHATTGTPRRRSGKSASSPERRFP